MKTINPTIPGLNHICLSVTNLNTSLEFYDVIMPLMGWGPRKSSTSSAYFGPNYEIYLQESKQPEYTHHRFGIGLQHMAFNAPSKEAVLALNEALKKIGAEITDEPKPYPHYTKEYFAVFFKDPSGIQLEFCYAPDLVIS